LATLWRAAVSIRVEDFHKVYDRLVAVAGLTFHVEPGEILGLVGPNGAGKTTTMRALAGIIAPTQGRLAIAGYDVVRDPVPAKRALAYVPDDPHLFDNLTVWEHFQFIAAAYRIEDGWKVRANALLEQFELTEKRDEIAAALSRGMRQKVAICCGYLHEPKALMLDEPLTGLDPRGIRTMKESIRRRADAGAAVMISSPLLSLVEDMCSTFLIMARGQMLLKGTLDELHRGIDESGRGETLEELFFRLTEEPPRSDAVGRDLPAEMGA
jgi:ABC-2 type transport system ATP-binding protein